MNYLDFFSTLPRDIATNNEKYNATFCNLYACLQNMFSKTSDNKTVFFTKHASEKTIDRFVKDKCITNAVGDIAGENLVTISGDWGIYKDGDNYVGQSSSKKFRLTIPGLEKMFDKFDSWFCPHLEDDIHEKIFPVPINIFRPDWNTDVTKSLADLRQIEKTKLCYANFTMTCNYRITLAEWIAEQDFIEHLFPRRFDGIDENVKSDVLSPERLTLGAFACKLAEYRFAIAPIGNGIDTHRLWECIITNTVPIVQDTFCNRVFSKIWPMIIVKRYELTDLKKEMRAFSERHGDNIEYDYSLLLEKNFDKLLERLKHESDRVRRERAQMEPVKQIVINF
tara:strand:+ start:1774 stop:2787 length:1014 start_codon:yes stop_codon:yes gene_type:complete